MKTLNPRKRVRLVRRKRGRRSGSSAGGTGGIDWAWWGIAARSFFTFSGTGGGGLDQGAALAADATAHAAPAIATQVAVGTVTSIGKAISNTPGVYNPVTVGITTRTVGMTTAGRLLTGAAEGVLTGKVLLDAGVYVGALVLCSQ